MDRLPAQEESLRNERELYHLVKSDGWSVVRDIINEKMSILRDVSNIPTDLSNEQLAREASARIYALALVDELLSELQARVDNFIAMTEETDENSDVVVRQ